MKKKSRVPFVILFVLLGCCIVVGILFVTDTLPESVSNALNRMFGSVSVPVVQEQMNEEEIAAASSRQLPDDMHGIWFDLDSDLKATAADPYGTLVVETNAAFNDFKNYLGDTVFLTPSPDGKFAGMTDDYGTPVDVVGEVLNHAALGNYYNVLVANDALLYDKRGNFTFDIISAYLSSYPFHSVMLDADSLSGSGRLAAAAEYFGEKIVQQFPGRSFGMLFLSDEAARYANADTVAALQTGRLQFCLVDAGGGMRSAMPFATVMAWWNTFAQNYPDVRFYCRHRNDLVCSNSSDWNSNIEICDQVRALWECERIHGSVFYNATALQTNRSSSSQRLSYLLFDGALEGFEVDALTFGAADDSVSFSGKAIKGHKLLCNRTALTDQGGDFQYRFSLQPGENLFSLFNAGTRLDYKIFQVTPESAAVRLQSETDAVSPYRDNGLGTALICRVLDQNTETVGAASDKDTYHADFSTMPVGTTDYVKAVTVSSEGDLRYELQSGNNVYAVHCELLHNAYVMPPNTLSVMGVDDSSPTKTDILLHTDWFVPVNVRCLPQSYYRGYRDFSFNISAFTAAYIDVAFANTAQFENAQLLTFSAVSPFSSAEVFSSENAIILRLYLRKTGQFYGYHVARGQNGALVLSFKKHSDNSLVGKTVMLDAGHGGLYMTGTALRDQSTAEKKTTLSIALKAKQMLEGYGATVVLTRYMDTPLTLEDRCAILTQQNPDIFVSIHCDGTENINDSGTHTFYFRPYSMPLASAIHESMVAVYRTYIYKPEDTNYSNIDRKIKYYPFFVTRMDHCPSVLVETGFMSNPVEGMILANDNYQYWMAQGIADGIRNYFAYNY